MYNLSFKLIVGLSIISLKMLITEDNLQAQNKVLELSMSMVIKEVVCSCPLWSELEAAEMPDLPLNPTNENGDT